MESSTASHDYLSSRSSSNIDELVSSAIPPLSVWEYVVFAFTLLVSALIGVYHYFAGNRQSSNEEYLLGERNMNIWVISVSLMASFMSAITLLGVPAEVYNYGAIFIVINLSYAIGTPICAHFFLPVFYRLKITSAYEYLELRFNRLVRIIASSVFMIQMIFYMGIVLYAPAIALSAVTGFSKWAAILSVGIICAFYCSFGGIKAVLWTDLFQSILMFVSVSLVAIRGVMFIGSVESVWHTAVQDGRINLWQFSPDPTIRHSFWSLVIGGIFIYTSIYGVNQTQVQRLLASRSLCQAQVALYISWPVTSLLSMLCTVTGLVMYAFFRGCDPILSASVAKSDQLLPYFMMKVCSQIPGLPGLFIAGIFSGALSSVSSFVNSLAAVTIEDMVKPILAARSIRLSQGKEVFVTRSIALFFGLLCLLLTILAEQMKGILEASLTVFGLVGGPLLGLFTLGMISSRCSSSSALIAFLTSLLFGVWIGFGSFSSGPKPVPLHRSIDQCAHLQPNDTLNFNGTSFGSQSDSENIFYLYRISYMYLAGLTFLIELLVGLTLSFTCLPNSSVVDPLLIFPLFRGCKETLESPENNLLACNVSELNGISSNEKQSPSFNNELAGVTSSNLLELSQFDTQVAANALSLPLLANRGNHLFSQLAQ